VVVYYTTYKYTIMYSDILAKLDLAQNEAKIYETLLREGESPVGMIAVKSKINRRNVYDSLNRLIEKGLVFEILQKGENRYKPVDPRKLTELLKEKEAALAAIMPDLLKMYGGKPHEEDVYIYRGVEGWKNFMRDILRLGEDVYVIGGKGVWADARLDTFRAQFLRDAAKAGIKIKVLYDHEIKEKQHKVLDFLKDDHRFLAKQFSTSSAVTVFGNQVVVQSNLKVGEINENTTCTVMVNQSIADTFRTWFQMMWQASGAKSDMLKS